MLTLGIDCAGKGLGVALADETGVIAEQIIQAGLRHSESLVPTIDHLVNTVGTHMEAVDGIAVTEGPGSFTSVRIGLNTVKGLCMARDIPLTTLSTLAAAAARFPCSTMPVVVWLDARRNEVYSGVYDTSDMIQPGNWPVAVKPDEVIDPAEWLRLHNEPVLFTGDGSVVYGNLIREYTADGASIAPSWGNLPAPGVVAVWGRDKILAGDVVSVEAAAPVYLRHSQAAEQKRDGT